MEYLVSNSFLFLVVQPGAPFVAMLEWTDKDVGGANPVWACMATPARASATSGPS